MISKLTIDRSKDLLKLAIPVSLGQFGHILTNLSDSIMLGHYNPTHMSAAAFAEGMHIWGLLFCLGLSMGITPLIANAEGAGDRSGSSRLLANGVVLYSGFGILIALGSVFGSDVLHHAGQDAEMANMSVGYYQYLSLSLIPLMIFQPFKQFAEGLSDTKTAMYISFGGNVINIIFNYLLIFGKAGFPEMGLMGAATATLGSRCLMAIAMMAYVLKHQKFKNYLVNFSLLHTRIKDQIELFKFSIPIAIQFTFEGGAFSLALVMVGWLGKEFIAAHNIALKLASMSFILISGVSQAASVKVGNALGALNFSKLKSASNIALTLSLIFMGLCAIAFVVGRNAFPLLFVSATEETIVASASALILIAAMFQLSDATQSVLIGCLRGMKDVTLPTIISIGSYWIICLPLGYLLAFKLNIGVTGIWYGILIGMTFSALLQYMRFRWKLKALKLELPVD